MSDPIRILPLSKPMLLDITCAKPRSRNERLACRVQGKFHMSFEQVVEFLAQCDLKTALALTQTYTYKWTGYDYEVLRPRIEMLYAILYPRFQTEPPSINECGFMSNLVSTAFDGFARRVDFNFQKHEVQWTNWDENFDKANKAWEDDPAAVNVMHI